MATAGNVIGAIAGAIIGFYTPIGPVAGAQIGWALGGVVDPEQISGPRLADRKVQVSSYGVSIPILYGGDAGAGNVIWSTDLIESDVEQGKGGPVVTLHEYSVSCAILIGEGPIYGIRRIWADAKLIYDLSETADSATQAASIMFASHMRFYPGNETQLPDPTMELSLGAGNVSAYRGYCYVVFENIPLKAFSNRLPNFRFETTTEDPELGAVESAVPLMMGPWTVGIDRPSHSLGRTQYSVYHNGVTTVSEDLAVVADVCAAAGYPAFIGYGNNRADGTEESIFIGTPTLNQGNGWARAYLFYNVKSPDVIINDASTSMDQVCVHRSPDPDKVFLIRGPAGNRLMPLRFMPGSATPLPHSPDYTPYGDVGSGACVLLPPDESGYFHFYVISAGLVVTAQRLLSPPNDQTCQPGDPMNAANGMAQVPGHPDFCISIDGTISANNQYEVVTGTFRQLQGLVEDSSTVYKLPIGPTLMPSDPNYNDQSFWDAAAIAAGVGGTYGVDYPVLVSQAATADFGISTVLGGSVALREIVDNVWVRAGGNPAQCNTAALDGIIVQGYSIARQMAARQAIVPLQQAYWWDFVESGREIKAVLRGGASAVSIGLDDLGASESDEGAVAVVPMRAQETELPATVTVSHPLRSKGYEIDTQRDKRITTGSQQTISVELAVVTTEQHAAEIASVLLYESWTARTERSWNTTRKYAKYEPTDVLTLDDGEFVYQMRVTDRSEEGSIIKWRGVDDAPAVYAPIIVGAVGSGAGAIGSISFDGPMRLELIDSPIVRDSDDDAGHYAAAAGYTGTFAGGTAFRSIDAGANYTNVATLRARATIGQSTGALGDYAGGNTVDEVNAVTLTMIGGATLASITQAQLLNDGNAAILGNEIIQFKRAELTAPNTYRISGLLRGRRGTEQHIGTHAAGERFVLFTPVSIYRMPGTLADLDVSALWKGVPTGQTLAEANSQAFTNTGAGLKPLSPAHLHAVELGGGQYRISWVRRTRIGGKWRDGVDVPLGETSESYTVVTSTAGTINSTTTTGASTLDVTAAPGDVVSVRQISSTVGPGFPASVTI